MTDYIAQHFNAGFKKINNPGLLPQIIILKSESVQEVEIKIH
ncbi:hypothetical protein J2X69_005164 [Algoriphagus sp. 4150]|nr:hypothetical protein [Algoriphagus sp. 4150]